MEAGEIQLVINTPLGGESRFDEAAIRAAALRLVDPVPDDPVGRDGGGRGDPRAPGGGDRRRARSRSTTADEAASRDGVNERPARRPGRRRAAAAARSRGRRVPRGLRGRLSAGVRATGFRPARLALALALARGVEPGPRGSSPSRFSSRCAGLGDRALRRRRRRSPGRCSSSRASPRAGPSGSSTTSRARRTLRAPTGRCGPCSPSGSLAAAARRRRRRARSGPLVHGLGLRAVNVEGLLGRRRDPREPALASRRSPAGAAFFFILRRAGPRRCGARALARRSPASPSPRPLAVAERLGLGPGRDERLLEGDRPALGRRDRPERARHPLRARRRRRRGRAVARPRGAGALAAARPRGCMAAGLVALGLAQRRLLAGRRRRRAARSRAGRAPRGRAAVARCRRRSCARRRRGPARLQRPRAALGARLAQIFDPPSRRVPRVGAAAPLGERRAPLRAPSGRGRGPRRVLLAASEPARRAGPRAAASATTRATPTSRRSPRPGPIGFLLTARPRGRARARGVGGAARPGRDGRGGRQRRGGARLPRRARWSGSHWLAPDVALLFFLLAARRGARGSSPTPAALDGARPARCWSRSTPPRRSSRRSRRARPTRRSATARRSASTSRRSGRAGRSTGRSGASRSALEPGRDACGSCSRTSRPRARSVELTAEADGRTVPPRALEPGQAVSLRLSAGAGRPAGLPLHALARLRAAAPRALGGPPRARPDRRVPAGRLTWNSSSIPPRGSGAVRSVVLGARGERRGVAAAGLAALLAVSLVGHGARGGLAGGARRERAASIAEAAAVAAQKDVPRASRRGPPACAERALDARRPRQPHRLPLRRRAGRWPRGLNPERGCSRRRPRAAGRRRSGATCRPRARPRRSSPSGRRPTRRSPAATPSILPLASRPRRAGGALRAARLALDRERRSSSPGSTSRRRPAPPVIAPAAGTVVFAGRVPAVRDSRLLAVRQSRRALARRRRARRCSATSAKIEVRRGERVRRGQRLGTVGTTGWAMSPGLHYELWRPRPDGRSRRRTRASRSSTCAWPGHDVSLEKMRGDLGARARWSPCRVVR